MTAGLLATSLTLQLYPTPVETANSRSAVAEVEAGSAVNFRPLAHFAIHATQNIEAEFQDAKPKVVTDATYAFTPTWRRCVIRPESNGKAHVPGTGGEFGFLTLTWQSEPYSSVWQSQEPPGADWSEPWKAPLDVQAEDALLLRKQNGGFGPSAWNNSANCGKNG